MPDGFHVLLEATSGNQWNTTDTARVWNLQGQEITNLEEHQQPGEDVYLVLPYNGWQPAERMALTNIWELQEQQIT